MKKYFFILILLLGPTSFVHADYSCAISFDQNPILYGQGTYLRWSVTQTGNPYYYGGLWDDGGSASVYLDIANVGRKGYWGSYYDKYYPTTGYVWVAPTATTNYSGTLTKTVINVGTVYSYCPATLTVNPANCSFNGNTVTSGSSVTAYQSSTVPYGSSCVSQTRTCNNGTLSGSYAYSSCAVGPYCTLTTDWDPINKDIGTIMRWTSANATALSISGIGSVSLSGSANIYPQVTTSYTGTVTGAGGSSNCAQVVNVASPATGSISVSPTSIVNGNTAMLSWSTSNADQGVYITGVGWVSASGSVQVGPSSNTTYTLTAYGFGGNNTYSTTLTVTPVPSCTLSLAPSTISSGASTLSYASADATAFTISGGVGAKTPNTSGTASVSPGQTTTYTGTASNSGITGTCSATLTYSCTPAYSCSGQTIQYTNSACQVSSPTTCVSPQFCSPGSSTCLWPPVVFTPSGSKTGHLQIKPQLVKKGGTTKVFWNVANVSSCTVTSSNNSWTGGTSGSSGQTSSSINEQTVFTLNCTGLDGSSVHETATAGVVPVFEEK